MSSNSLVRIAFILTASALAAIFTWSCAKPLPPIPTPSVQGIDPEVRDAIMTAYRQAVAEPASGRASGHFGMVLQAHSYFQKAELAYERAIRLEPKEFAWRYYSALALEQLSQPQEAVDAILGASSIRPDYAPAILKSGDLLFQMGRFNESAAAYESLLRPAAAGVPASAPALSGLARAKYAQQDIAAAGNLYRQATEAYPAFGAAYYGLALVARSRGCKDEEARYFNLAERHMDDRPPVADPLLSQVDALRTGVHYREQQAEQLLRSGKSEEGARLMEEILKRDPENFRALIGLLSLAQSSNRYDRELGTLYTTAKQISPQHHLIYSYYGFAMARQGRYDASAAALQKSVELEPDDAEAHIQLAKVLEKLNRPADAREEYRRALAARPSDRATPDVLVAKHGRPRPSPRSHPAVAAPRSSER